MTFSSVDFSKPRIAGWSQDPISGFREKSGAELAFVKRASVFRRELKLRELYSKMELRGKEKIGDQETWLIIATPSDGAPEKFYFDSHTGLLIRSDFELDTPQGKMSFEVYFEDRRSVDGAKTPFIIRTVNPVISSIIRLTEVKRNIQVEDAKFNRPTTQ